mmetsp:Transcript_23217/g.22756  ORF Transcript_23217/g.22756 Transcript_23217/m.22756 type:complete len:328 (-) Transcript_23217:665-1648(-)
MDVAGVAPVEVGLQLQLLEEELEDLLEGPLEVPQVVLLLDIRLDLLHREAVVDLQRLLQLLLRLRQEVQVDLVLRQLQMQTHPQHVLIRLDRLQRPSRRLERLVHIDPRRLLQQRDAVVPDQDASLNDDVRISQPLVGYHGPLQDLQSVHTALELLDLLLEGVQLHPRLRVHIPRRLLDLQLRLRVLSPHLRPQGALSRPRHHTDGALAQLDQVIPDRQTPALSQSVLRQRRDLGGLLERCGVVRYARWTQRSHNRRQLLLHLRIRYDVGFDGLDDVEGFVAIGVLAGLGVLLDGAQDSIVVPVEVHPIPEQGLLEVALPLLLGQVI